MSANENNASFESSIKEALRQGVEKSSKTSGAMTQDLFVANSSLSLTPDSFLKQTLQPYIQKFYVVIDKIDKKLKIAEYTLEYFDTGDVIEIVIKAGSEVLESVIFMKGIEISKDIAIIISQSVPKGKTPLGIAIFSAGSVVSYFFGNEIEELVKDLFFDKTNIFYRFNKTIEQLFAPRNFKQICNSPEECILMNQDFFQILIDLGANDINLFQYFQYPSPSKEYQQALAKKQELLNQNSLAYNTQTHFISDVNNHIPIDTEYLKNVEDLEKQEKIIQQEKEKYQFALELYNEADRIKNEIFNSLFQSLNESLAFQLKEKDRAFNPNESLSIIAKNEYSIKVLSQKDIDNIHINSSFADLRALFLCESVLILDKNNTALLSEQKAKEIFNYNDDEYILFLLHKNTLTQEYIEARKKLYKTMSLFKELQIKDLENTFQNYMNSLNNDDINSLNLNNDNINSLSPNNNNDDKDFNDNMNSLSSNNQTILMNNVLTSQTNTNQNTDKQRTLNERFDSNDYNTISLNTNNTIKLNPNTDNTTSLSSNNTTADNTANLKQYTNKQEQILSKEQEQSFFKEQEQNFSKEQFKYFNLSSSHNTKLNLFIIENKDKSQRIIFLNNASSFSNLIHIFAHTCNIFMKDESVFDIKLIEKELDIDFTQFNVKIYFYEKLLLGAKENSSCSFEDVKEQLYYYCKYDKENISAYKDLHITYHYYTLKIKHYSLLEESLNITLEPKDFNKERAYKDYSPNKLLTTPFKNSSLKNTKEPCFITLFLQDEHNKAIANTKIKIKGFRHNEALRVVNLKRKSDDNGRIRFDKEKYFSDCYSFKVKLENQEAYLSTPLQNAKRIFNTYIQHKKGLILKFKAKDYLYYDGFNVYHYKGNDLLASYMARSGTAKMDNKQASNKQIALSFYQNAENKSEGKGAYFYYDDENIADRFGTLPEGEYYFKINEIAKDTQPSFLKDYPFEIGKTWGKYNVCLYTNKECSKKSKRFIYKDKKNNQIKEIEKKDFYLYSINEKGEFGSSGSIGMAESALS